MDDTFDPNTVNRRVKSEIEYFLKNEPALKADVEYVWKIAIPARPKAYLMLQFAKVLKVRPARIMPFVIVADLMMAAAMNDDDIIDDNPERCGETSLWKIKGLNSAIMVTGYMYALVFSILKKYRPSIEDADFAAYQKSENLLIDYFRLMHVAQYKTTASVAVLKTFTLRDLDKLATQKASLLFQFCTAVPAYFANNFVTDLEEFGYQLGVVRQYVSDVQDFLEVAPEHDHNMKAAGAGHARMEDYFTHQPNLILVLTGTSSNLTEDERNWFYNNWCKDIVKEDRGDVMRKVILLVKKAEVIQGAKVVLKGIQKKLAKSLSRLPDKEFAAFMTAWAFRSFPLE